MTRQVFRDFATGLTAILGIVGLCLMLIWFGEISGRLERTYTLRLHLPAAGGIKETSPVTLNGVKVGQVKRTANLAAPFRGVEITARIKDGVAIPRASRVSIEKGFVGEASLEFTVPQDLHPAQLTDTLKEGEPPLEVRDVGSLIADLKQAVSQPLARFEKTADAIEKLADTYTTLGQRLSDMVEPRTLAEVHAGKPPNLRSSLERLDHAIAGAEQWLSDDDLRDRAKQLLAKAQGVLDDASGLVKGLDDSRKNLDAAVSQTSRDVSATVTQAGRDVSTAAARLNTTLSTIDKASGELSSILEGVSRGQGTLGQLAQNPDLYNNLRGASERLDQALVEFKLVLEKLKAEGIKIGL